MPVVIFMNAVIAAGYYFGVVQAFIATFGRFLSACLGTTPVESVSAAANIFLGPVSRHSSTVPLRALYRGYQCVGAGIACW